MNQAEAIDILVGRGVLERLPDGGVRIPRAAWRNALRETRYAEPEIHFVGFKDDRWWSAVKVFGRPDYIHRFWDARAAAEIAPNDIVVFAEGDESTPVREFAYDDSAYF